MDDRKQWLEQRRKGIGASEAAAVLGMNPHISPLEVWLSKLHPEMLPERGDEDFLEFGTELEGPIERRYVKETGNRVYKPTPSIVFHPRYPELLCTPDGLCDSPEKIVVEYKFEKWSDGFGEIGTDEIPEHFLIQGCHQMACCDRNRVDFGVLHGAPPIRVYRAHRDLELEAQLIDRIRGWWSDYVVKDVEPPVDASGAWKDYLGKKFPKPSGKILPVEAGSPIYTSAISLLELSKEIKEAEQEEKQLQNEIRAFIGEADGLQLADGTRIMWTSVKESEIKVYTRKGYRKLDIREASCKKSKKSE